MILKFNIKCYSLLFLSLLLISSFTYGQRKSRTNYGLLNDFHKLERSISLGDVSGITNFLGDRVFVSLPNNGGNYYSYNHIYYLLKKFFSSHNALYFSFDKISLKNSNPFGYGQLTVEINGVRKRATVYVSFSKFGNRWKMTQFTVN